MAFRALALAALFAVAHGEDHWAVLVAGSNTFSNYRHQADVCHAYHVLLSRGFQPDKIITMMYDDVANSRENPFKGKLFNFPWKNMSDAVDVYDGCKIDYRTKDVTPKKFLAVLRGDAKAAGGRVLESKATDHVFINFVDHGAVGLIAFPNDRVLHAKELISTLMAMHHKGLYKQLTFYLETCESGSMFQGLLPKSLPVYALTAANSRESSWGTYCDVKVGGKHIDTCLGDLFSVKWMQDSDKTAGSNETMKQQYARVKARTKKSHVMEYGQVHHIGTEQVSDFQGPGEGALEVPPDADDADIAHTSAVDSRDATLNYLYRAYLRKGTAEAADRLTREIKARQAVKDLGKSLMATVQGGSEAAGEEIVWTEELLDCHERATASFGATCGWTEARLPLSRSLYNLCTQASSNTDTVTNSISDACWSTVDEVVV